MSSEERLARLALLEAGQRLSGIFRNRAEDKRRARDVSLEIMENILRSEDPDLKTWTLAPLSGQENFLAEIPFFALGVIHKKNDEAQYLAILDPLRDELFEAALDFPVLLNGREIAPMLKKRRELSLASFAGKQPKNYPYLWRSFGSWLLENAYLAANRLDFLLYDAELLSEKEKAFSWISSQSGAVFKEVGGEIMIQRVKKEL